MKYKVAEMYISIAIPLPASMNVETRNLKCNLPYHKQYYQIILK